MKRVLKCQDEYGLRRTKRGIERSYRGEVELIFKDRNGMVIDSRRDHNIIKIYAKEILAHRLPGRNIWDPNASSGTGAWVSSGIDVLEELAARYIVFGASFDSSGAPLDSADPRYYTNDPTSGGYVPIRLGVGADYGGGLINPIPIAEPTRPLKRIERIYFEPSYQPAGTPLLQDDVRAMNNVVVMETTLRKDEYNGLNTVSNYFTITEVALVAAKEVGSVGACECDPHTLFLSGDVNNNDAILAYANGSATVTIDPSEQASVNVIQEGDQIKLVQPEATAGQTDSVQQVTPFYLVINKAVGGSDLTLDRVPVDTNGNPITGAVGLFRDGFRIASHRILSVPAKKSDSFEIVVRWRWILA